MSVVIPMFPHGEFAGRLPLCSPEHNLIGLMTLVFTCEGLECNSSLLAIVSLIAKKLRYSAREYYWQETSSYCARVRLV